MILLQVFIVFVSIIFSQSFIVTPNFRFDPFGHNFHAGEQYYASSILPPTQWFDQRLDHFNHVDLITWKQRYFVDLEHFDRSNVGAPIFLEIQGEWIASNFFGGSIVDYAKHYGAAIVKLEHRYYGESHPRADISTSNLQFLNSEQALRDIANFIEYAREKYQLQGRKWIIFGGSYGGTLAAWFRYKYPHLVAGAVASSAPVRSKLDFFEYFEVIGASLGPNCSHIISSGMRELEHMLKSPETVKIINQEFKLCQPLDVHRKKDVSLLVSNIANPYAGIVQYNQNIHAHCAFLAAPAGKTPLEKLAEIVRQRVGKSCVDVKYEHYVAYLQNLTAIINTRLWTYQICTEFGNFQTTNSPNQPFGHYHPVDFYTDLCADVFGPQYNRKFIEDAIKMNNNFYGDHEFSPTNVVFVNGLIDPYHKLGLLKQINPTVKIIILPESAHVADAAQERADDPVSLKEARKEIQKSIGQFLGHL